MKLTAGVLAFLLAASLSAQSSTKPNLSPVTVPATTDIVSVRQSGDTRDKRETLAQILGLTHNATTATSLAADPADCADNFVATGIQADGTAVCDDFSSVVFGPASSTADALAVYTNTTGKAIRNSAATLTTGGVFSLTGQLNLDNLRLDGNTISSQDANGDIVASPNGTGKLRTTATLFQLGGSTSSFPALKQNNANIQLRSADDSAYGQLFVLGWEARNGGGQTIIGAYAGGGGFDALALASGIQLKWGSTPTDTGSADTGLARGSAGRVKVTDGSSGVGALLGSKGADIASANDITLGNANYFVVTGTTQINTIAATNWTAGSCIVLQFSGSLTVKNATAGAGAQLKLAGSADFSATADDTLSICYDGSTWRETARTAI